MLSPSFLAGLALLAILSVALRSPALFLLTLLVAFVAGAAWLWDKFCLSGVTYSRRLEAQRLFVGESTDLWVEIVNAKPLPLTWLKAQDEFPDTVTVSKTTLTPSGDLHRRLLTNLFAPRWYERVRRHYQVWATRRGVFDIGPVRLASGDIFGFRARHTSLPQMQTLTVYPKVVPMQALHLQPARPLGEEPSLQRILTDPLKLAGVRDYASGDSIRHIHWKATARRGSLQTKVFDPSASQQLCLCLNLETQEGIYGGILADDLETAIVLAASLAHAALEARVPVGLLSNGTLRNEDGLVRLPASRQPQHELRLLELLAQITYFTQIQFDRLLRAEARQVGYGATLIVISPLFTDGIMIELDGLRRAGHPVALILVGERYVAHRPTIDLPETGVPVYYLTDKWADLETIKLG